MPNQYKDLFNAILILLVAFVVFGVAEKLTGA